MVDPNIRIVQDRTELMQEMEPASWQIARITELRNAMEPVHNLADVAKGREMEVNQADAVRDVADRSKSNLSLLKIDMSEKYSNYPLSFFRKM